MRKRIHLIAPAGSCKPFFRAVGIHDARDLVGRVRSCIGEHYEVTADPTLIEVDEDESHGGRRDDDARAKDIENALGDSSVAAIVALRGGAWFTRVLPWIDFSLLDRRTTRIVAFGFSELTTLINIVAGHQNGLGVYDMGPAFLVYGMKRFAAQRIAADDPEFANATPADWMLANWSTEFRHYFQRVIRIIEGREEIKISANLASGSLADVQTVRIVGGNLTVLSTMIGSPYDPTLKIPNCWIVLEDFNDKLERVDRFLSHLTLAGVWERISGVLLGDFHQAEHDQLPAVLEMLKSHIPDFKALPILTTKEVGHIWPMTPLPLNQLCAIRSEGAGRFRLCFDRIGLGNSNL
ncbi:MAG: LD-carboxypeptidase [Planctomycetes bacterium]|nr:LD-carboxypeptidase [Planctomycetota bacterium]MBI3832750.1 LD-carboxypeptidase [Planctomycetota bacterium]